MPIAMFMYVYGSCIIGGSVIPGRQSTMGARWGTEDRASLLRAVSVNGYRWLLIASLNLVPGHSARALRNEYKRGCILPRRRTGGYASLLIPKPTGLNYPRLQNGRGILKVSDDKVQTALINSFSSEGCLWIE